MLLLSSADFFKINFKKKILSGTLVNLNPDQDRHNVGPDLGSNCLQRLSADDKSYGVNKLCQADRYILRSLSGWEIKCCIHKAKPLTFVMPKILFQSNFNVI